MDESPVLTDYPELNADQLANLKSALVVTGMEEGTLDGFSEAQRKPWEANVVRRLAKATGIGGMPEDPKDIEGVLAKKEEVASRVRVALEQLMPAFLRGDKLDS